MEKYYKFSVLAGMVANNSDAIAIVCGQWFGLKTPTPVEVRDRIKLAIAPWFETPTGVAAIALYNDFHLGDLYSSYGSEIGSLLERAGIIDLHIEIVESTSDWDFADSLLPDPEDPEDPEGYAYDSPAAAEKDGYYGLTAAERNSSLH